MFMGLAIVADDYFVPALDKLAESKYGFRFQNTDPLRPATPLLD